jgi:hypothetical protein
VYVKRTSRHVMWAPQRVLKRHCPHTDGNCDRGKERDGPPPWGWVVGWQPLLKKLACCIKGFEWKHSLIQDRDLADL